MRPAHASSASLFSSAYPKRLYILVTPPSAWFSTRQMVDTGTPDAAIPVPAVRRRSCSRHSGMGALAISSIRADKRSFAFEKPDTGRSPAFAVINSSVPFRGMSSINSIVSGDIGTSCARSPLVFSRGIVQRCFSRSNSDDAARLTSSRRWAVTSNMRNSIPKG